MIYFRTIALFVDGRAYGHRYGKETEQTTKSDYTTVPCDELKSFDHFLVCEETAIPGILRKFLR